MASGKRIPTFYLVVGLAIALLVVFLVARKEDQHRPPAEVNPAAATNSPSVSAETLRSFEKLKGKWLRPDGGYVLEIRAIAPDAKLEAAYLNPQPINVSRAMALSEGGLVKVFVELRDTGYPGCTYSLQYDPQRDILEGIYFQAAQQQEYPVEFARLPQ